jgi:hypothetical protein
MKNAIRTALSIALFSVCSAFAGGFLLVLRADAATNTNVVVFAAIPVTVNTNGAIVQPTNGAAWFRTQNDIASASTVTTLQGQVTALQSGTTNQFSVGNWLNLIPGYQYPLGYYVGWDGTNVLVSSPLKTTWAKIGYVRNSAATWGLDLDNHKAWDSAGPGYPDTNLWQYLNADQLDGHEGTYFSPTNHTHAIYAPLALSVTNSWVDAAGVTQQLEFISGSLSAWLTNGVAVNP